MDIDKNSSRHKIALIFASSYITGFEILKSAIVDHLQDYFFDKKDLLEPDKKKFDASCKWYFKKKIITKNELKRLKEIRDYRNKLTHELINIMFLDEEGVNLENLEELNFYIKKITFFWAEMEYIDPEKDDFKSGQMLIMNYLIDIVIELNQKNYS